MAIGPVVISRCNNERMFEALSLIFSVRERLIAARKETVSVAAKIGLEIAIMHHEG